MDVSKQTIEYHDCKVSTHRLDREVFRLCPAKLSKKELEDLYYELTEANINLKKALNSQKDKIKLLSTKLLRINAVRRAYSNKDNSCCSSLKIALEEQRHCITELRRTNNQLTEKNRQLNASMCSAKQFLKRSPYQSTPRSKTVKSIKHSGVSLNSKQSEGIIQNHLKNIAELELLSPILANTNEQFLHESNNNDADLNKLNEDQKNKTEIEVLRETIKELHTNIDSMTQAHQTRCNQLEQDLLQSKSDLVRLKAASDSLQSELKSKSDECRKLNMVVRDLEMQCNELRVELSLTKKLVNEMETRAKSAELSSQLSKTIEQHLSNEILKKQNALSTLELGHNKVFQRHQVSVLNVDDTQSPKEERSMFKEGASKNEKETAEAKLEDSGFNEPSRNTTTDDSKELLRLNQELIIKLSHLQTQLNSIQISTVTPQKQATETYLTSNITEDNDQSTELFQDDNLLSKTDFKHSTPIKTDSIDKTDKTIGNFEDFENVLAEDVLKSPVYKNKESKLYVKSDTPRLPNEIELTPVTNKVEKCLQKIDTKTHSLNRSDVKQNSKTKSNFVTSKVKNDNARHSRTYSISNKEGNINKNNVTVNKKDDSTDNTENDVSSITSIEEDDKTFRDRLSLGERRMSALSDTSTTLTSGEFESLSEGEIAFGRMLSEGEKYINRRHCKGKPQQNNPEPLSKSIGDTLEAITKEFNLCGKLLNILPTASTKVKRKT